MSDSSFPKPCNGVDIPDYPLLMGIVNVTPDSFSDGGEYLNPEAAIGRGQELRLQGADLIDVGGESTRPGASMVAEHEERQRVLPVVYALSKAGLMVSVDTQHASVAKAALEHGACVVNDVSALADPEMLEVCADWQATLCLMHMQGNPQTMQAQPEYGDVVNEVLDYLLTKAALAERMGQDRDRIWIDPGIGFGKNLEHNLSLLAHLEQFCRSPYPVLIGVSRKSFIGRLTEVADPQDRLEGTLAAQVLAQAKGVKIIRTHDVRSSKRALEVSRAILDASR